MVNAFATRDVLNSSADLIARLDSFMPLCRTVSTRDDLMVPDAEYLEPCGEDESMVEMTISMGLYDATINENWAPPMGLPVIDSPYIAAGASAHSSSAAHHHKSSIVEIQELSDVLINEDIMLGEQQQGLGCEFNIMDQENLKPSPSSKKRRYSNNEGMRASSLVEEV